MVVIPTSSRHSGASRNLTCAGKRLPGQTTQKETLPPASPTGCLNLLPPSRPTVVIPAYDCHPGLLPPSRPAIVIPGLRSSSRPNSRHSGASRNLTCPEKRLPSQTTPKETRPATSLIGYLNLLPPSPTSDTAGSQVGQIIRKGPSAPVAAFTARLGDYGAPAGSPGATGRSAKRYRRRRHARHNAGSSAVMTPPNLRPHHHCPRRRR